SGGSTALRIASALLLALASCGEKREDHQSKPPDPAQAPPTTEARPTPAAPVVPLPPAVADALKLTSSIDLPPVFAKLKPFMRKKDALAICAGIPPGTLNSDWTVHAEPDLTFAIGGDRVGVLVFDGDRLTGVIVVDDAHPSTLIDAVHAAWGNGAEDSSESTRFMSQIKATWGAGAAGWTAELSAYPGFEPDFDSFGTGDVKYKAKPPTRTVLQFSAVTAPTKAESTDGDTVAMPSDKMVAEAGALLGSTLAVAQKKYGDDMRMESGDDDSDAAESTAEQQGYVRTQVPWGSDPWELTLHVSAKTKKIDHVTLEGRVADDQRKSMFAALRRDFGAPKPVVDDEGYVGIEYTSARSVLYIQAGVEDLAISITPR
ncbi:MAG TPA: hypothetical protein VGM90_32360, partial [Kofleriaceae bacterium]